MKKNRPVDKLYKQIAIAQDKLNTIRKKCKHKNTHIGLYSWRVGSINEAELCNVCDAVTNNFSSPVKGSQNNTVTITSFTSSNKFGGQNP